MLTELPYGKFTCKRDLPIGYGLEFAKWQIQAMNGETIKRLRNAKKLTLEQAAERIGVSVSQLSRFESGQREMRQSEMAEMASLYEVPISMLFGLAEGGVSADLISWVSAGSMRTPEGVHEREEAQKIIDHDLDPSGDWIALKVDGDSMDRISPPDSIIFVNLKERRLVPNACYVIADTETGDASYKRWRNNPSRFEPVSTNTAHEPMFVAEGNEPRVIGRVRKTMLRM